MTGRLSDFLPCTGMCLHFPSPKGSKYFIQRANEEEFKVQVSASRHGLHRPLAERVRFLSDTFLSARPDGRPWASWALVRRLVQRAAVLPPVSRAARTAQALAGCKTLKVEAVTVLEEAECPGRDR